MSFWADLFSSKREPAAVVASGDAGTTQAVGPQRQSSIGVPYRLQRVRRKSIGLVITTDGLLIRAPKWTPLYEIDAAICEREQWIRTALERQMARRQQLAALRDGGHLLFRGQKLKVELRPGLFDSVDLSERHCILTTTDGLFHAELLEAEIKRRAKTELPEIAWSLAREAGLPLTGVALSSARTLWGSCTVDGRVRLNFRLLHLPPALMRHVVAHELAHLVEFNHSARFWAIVEKLDPQMKAHKRAIKQYSVLLEL